MHKQAMIKKAKSFYKSQCQADASKRNGVLYVHNLVDIRDQRWSASFKNGRFVSIYHMAR